MTFRAELPFARKVHDLPEKSLQIPSYRATPVLWILGKQWIPAKQFLRLRVNF